MPLSFERLTYSVGFKPRAFPKDYKPIPAIPRTALGVEPRQRPATQKVDPLPVYQARWSPNLFDPTCRGRVVVATIWNG